MRADAAVEPRHGLAQLIHDAALLFGLVIPHPRVILRPEVRTTGRDIAADPVTHAGGRLVPREVRLGARANGYYEVLDGLRKGEVVVTSGNFLVAAESKLRTPSQKW